MPKVLLTRPAYETTTRYLSAWNQKAINAALRRKWQVTDLKGKSANKINLEKSLAKDNPDLVLLNGHGNYTTITGDKSEVLIEVGVNAKILKDKIVHAFSCETAKTLGPAAVKAGAKAYIGYDEPFVFMATEGFEAAPLKDKRAAIFLDPAILVSLDLLDGKTAGVAHQNSAAAFSTNIQKLISSASKSTSFARYLLWDLKHQKCLGDKDATVDHR